MSWFPPKERATINGINAVAFNLGTGIILWQMSNFNSLTGSWQNTLIIFSLASLALSIAWLFVDEAKPDSKAKDTNEINAHYSYTDGLKDKFSWVYALTYSGILAFYLCLFTFYPKAGISQSALLIGFGIIGTLAGIIYSKKFPLRVPVIRWSGLLIVITVFTLSFSPSELVQTLSAMVLGFSIFFPITALVAIPHELSKMTSQKITVVFSLFYSISYMVGTLVLWLFGKLVDIHQGDYTWAFALTTLVSGTFFIGSFFLTETGQQQNKEDELCEV
jgi:CP family cyanate transporter-like MFS transporter